LGVKSNDEVLIPSISFVAPANAILYNGAIPHFVDSELNHFGIDADKLDRYLKKNTFLKNNVCINKKTKRVIKAIVIVHVFGHPAEIIKLIAIGRKYKIKVLEDAAEALGSLYNGKQVGTFGDVGILSFNGNKIVTTGVGGAIITNKTSLAKLSRHLSTTSKLNHKWDFVHNMIGYNYRLANLNASLGISQIDKLNKFILHKQKLLKKFKSFVKDSSQLKILDQPKKCRSNFWLHTLILKNSSKSKKDKLLNELHKNKIFARPIWRPLHKLKFLKKYPKMNLKNSEFLENKIINIPSSFYL
jgi:perosamine synthetase